MSEELKPFQRVLVRGNDDREWGIDLFDRMVNGQYLCLTGAYYQCLPYNDETKHLLGTTDSPTPPEPEFRWGDKVEVRNDKYNDWKKALFCNRNGGLNICLAIGDSMVTGWRRCRHADW